ncbi:MAG TPA: hypothetical protein VIO57_10230 [Chloroflexota bacterium]|jgi:hypothetical protein
MTGPWPDGTRGVVDNAPMLPILAKFPDATLDFTIDITAAIDTTVDFIASASLVCAPSGTGEMQISNLQVAGDSVTYTAAGGQPGRWYTLKLLVTMSDARVYTFLGTQPITPVLPTDQPSPTPPSAGFGSAITWAYLPSLVFTQVRNTALRLWGWN